MNALLLIALLLACFELAVLFLLPAVEIQNNTKRATNVPPADADEDADALPFGPVPRDTDY